MKKFIKISLTVLSLIVLLNTCSIAVTGTVNAKRGLVLRQEADKNGNPLILIPSETEIEITGKIGDWYKTTYESLEGYVYSDFVDVSEDISEEPENNNKSKSIIKIYSIPLITSTVINEVPENTEVIIEKQITNWSYIKAGEIEGWARTYAVNGGEIQIPVEEQQNPEQQIIENTDVEENEEPTINEEEPTTNNEEEEVNNEEPSTQVPENSGEEERATTVETGIINVDSANIRKEPTTSSEVVTNLIKGTKFSIKAETTDWYKMQYTSADGTVYDGYIFKDLVSVQD